MSAQPSHLPKAVRDAAARAEQLAKDMKNPPAPSPAAAPTVPLPSPAAAAAAPPPPPAEVVPEWEQKYRVLQGKYNAEVPRLLKENQAVREEIQQLRQQLNNTQALLASMGDRGAPPPAPPPPAQLVTPDEVKEFGADLIDVMRRVAKEVMVPEIETRVKPVTQRIEQTERVARGAAETTIRTAKQKVLDLLASEVPKFQEVNGEPGFLAWLQETDPYAGRQRDDLLQEAWKANDGPRVVRFFKGYLAENAAMTPPPPAAPTPEAPPALEAFVAPGTPKSGPGSAPQDAGKRVWTRAEIGALYRSIQQFVQKGRKVPDELRVYERDIVAAQKEGRVR